MKLEEYQAHDGIGLAERVRRRETTPSELLELAIASVEAKNPAVNAVVERLYARARRRIEQGVPDGPFFGVPFLVKDAIALGGERLAFGSVFLKDNVAPTSHPILDRAEAAGLVIFGRTSTSEFGLLPLTEASLFGPTRNPWDLERSAGGSSGGSAAAVAARMVPLAHANDGGGSIRIPAAACGVFGLKPSRGRTPGTPLDPPDGFISELCVSRSVRDSAALLDVIAGPKAGDRWWAPPPTEPYAAAVERDPPRLRIAFSTIDVLGRRADPECVRAVEDAAKLCASLGHEVIEDRPQVEGEAYMEAFVDFWATMIDYIFLAIQGELEKRAPRFARRLVGQRAVLLGIARSMAIAGGRPGFEALTMRLATLASDLKAADHMTIWNRLQQAAYVVGAFLERHDVWLQPVLGEPPWRLGTLDPKAPIEELRTRLLSYAGFTPIANTAGLPAMSVPLGWTAADLPVGVQFVGRFGGEATLFGLAGQLERARPWATRRPRGA